jgi:hypothetical protein
VERIVGALVEKVVRAIGVGKGTLAVGRILQGIRRSVKVLLISKQAIMNA